MLAEHSFNDGKCWVLRATIERQPSLELKMVPGKYFEFLFNIQLINYENSPRVHQFSNDDIASSLKYFYSYYKSRVAAKT